MFKYINYLISCGLLLLFCCKAPTTDYKRTTDYERKVHVPVNLFNGLTSDEKLKLKTLMAGFRKIIKHDDQLIKAQKEQYEKFEEWLLQDIQKQKDLADSFKYTYYFLEQDKPKQTKNLTIAQLVVNTIDCIVTDKCSDRNDVYDYDNDNHHYKEQIKNLFAIFLNKILSIPNNTTNVNEKMFKCLQSELIYPNNLLIIALGKETAFLKQRFNDNQIQILSSDLLQNKVFKIHGRGQYLSPQYVSFIKLSNSIIKPILDHIYDELLKCNGNQQSLDNFAQDLENYFDSNEINDETMKQLPNIVTIKCE
ncbi:Congo red-binding lipoprotein nlph [Borrelia duttonii CR2A]|uniref:Congo red-binding lipoprotein nlph n=1 Tax=Borrelia duttonii CR2A TaxID=1432657 RepID=W6TGV6_9SPIR|nr:Mlp family lipoprotein [Borrelia duttonii]ETZ17705.1 Congo red-binding lipoprotein nlph [Borrelia duttonii CR2A]